MKTKNGKSGYWGSDGGRCTVQFSIGFVEDGEPNVKFLAGRRHYVPMDDLSFVAQDINNIKTNCFAPQFYEIPEDAEKRRKIFGAIMDNSLHGRHSLCFVSINSAEEFIREIREMESRIGGCREVEKIFAIITFDNGDSLHLVLYNEKFAVAEGVDAWLQFQVTELRFMESREMETVSGNG